MTNRPTIECIKSACLLKVADGGLEIAPVQMGDAREVVALHVARQQFERHSRVLEHPVSSRQASGRSSLGQAGLEQYLSHSSRRLLAMPRLMKREGMPCPTSAMASVYFCTDRPPQFISPCGCCAAWSGPTSAAAPNLFFANKEFPSRRSFSAAS